VKCDRSTDTSIQRALTEYPLVILVISTTGQGEIPKNAKVFWKRLLSKKLPPTVFKSVRFTTFGLGDSSYVKSVSFLLCDQNPFIG
jgi:sulfite reductase alpha subunit-like flavoprotein